MEKTNRRDLPVGVIDSGVGGISVLRELVKLMPGEDFLFFGDSVNAPYGIKSREWICETVLSHTARLRERGIKALVVACNTATSAAIKELRAVYDDMPVIGIEPALKPAVMVKEHPNVLVLATPGTVTGEKFQNLMQGFAGKAEMTALPCPGLIIPLSGEHWQRNLERMSRSWTEVRERPGRPGAGCFRKGCFGSAARGEA